MLLDINQCNKYIVTGRTDMRKGIDGLIAIIQEYQVDIYSNAIFIFAGLRRDRLKLLYFDGDGFVLTSKRLDNGRFKWPKEDDSTKLRSLSSQQYRWLLEGISIDQATTIQKSDKGSF